MERRHPNVINIDEVEPWAPPAVGEFRPVHRILGPAAGAQKLGCTFYELAPGALAFPFHWHGANEEAVLVIEGEGRMRIGDVEVTVRAGDFVSFPVGPDHAHQLRAVTPMRYYCLSTTQRPEVVGYPDSRKILAAVGTYEAPVFRGVFREEDTVGYYEREEKAKPPR